ncbi:MAG TPA: AI-2E family transporter [Bryobacteraceae bacterium]|nr:AI-2E family transporter [Bryobacteraceae bacterium]
MKRSPLKWVILLGATAGAIYLCGMVLRPFLDVIAWSLVLAITFYPVHQRLLNGTKRPSLSAFLSSLLVVLTILVPVLLITALGVSELGQLKNLLQARFKGGIDLNGIGPVRHVMDWLDQYLELDLSNLSETLLQHAKGLTQIAAKFSLSFAGNITGLIVSFVFTVFTVFYLFRDGARLVGKIPEFLPLERPQSEALIRRIGDVIDGSIYGVLVIAVIQGALAGLAFAILRVPSPVLWGLVTSLASLIPMFGAASVWVPCAIYLLVIGNWGGAIALAVFGGLVISSVDNFLRPRLVGQRIRLNELVMFFSVLGGLQVFGVLGIVLGPVLFAIAGSLIETLGKVELTGSGPSAVASKQE